MPLIHLDHISKSFGGIPALTDVSLTLPPASVLGLLGENGAGKSTLMNILYGLLRPDSGQIRIDNTPTRIASPRDAIAHGIGMVHQHFMLAGALTILDNILLGDRRQSQFLNRTRAAARLEKIASDMGLEINPFARVEDLSVGQQQRVEILKALWRNVTTLILDEPTAVLTPMETRQLLDSMSRLRAQGHSIIFISHKLAEVKSICDHVAILRRGQLVWHGDARSETESTLATLMVGREIRTTPPASRFETPNAAPLLTIDHLTAAGLHDISLTLHSEILGIAGVDGNGQQELSETLIGLRPIQSGHIELSGHDITHLKPSARFNLGLSHIPNDRKSEGLILDMDIPSNLLLKHHRLPPHSRLGLLNWPRARKLAAQLVQDFDIRTPSLSAPLSSLSGGNQQKVILARELRVHPPRIIIAINPTRGLDIAASEFVYSQLLTHKRQGCGILLISSELDDLLRFADRIAVLYRGHLTMTRYPHEGIDRIGNLMAGLETQP